MIFWNPFASPNLNEYSLCEHFSFKFGFLIHLVMLSMWRILWLGFPINSSKLCFSCHAKLEEKLNKHNKSPLVFNIYHSNYQKQILTHRKHAKLLLNRKCETTDAATWIFWKIRAWETIIKWTNWFHAVFLQIIKIEQNDLWIYH